MKLKTKVLLIVSIMLVIVITNVISGIYNQSVSLYNTTASYKLEYQRKEQELVSFFDAKYLAFSKKEKIATVNKDVFIVVTNLIMSNRKDGEQLAWKWVHENQQIPYEEFTSFYRELSSFVDDQYGGVFQIERDKQLIVNKHNELLVLYPNNVYNSFIHIPPLQYRYGYLSDSTRKLFHL